MEVIINLSAKKLKRSGDLYYIDTPSTLNLSNCKFIEEYAFCDSKFIGKLKILNCKKIGQHAFASSEFSEITINDNVILERGCIGAHSEEFISDYEANGRQAGTYVWNGEHWIYQKYIL
jgi:hypothetical protein